MERKGKYSPEQANSLDMPRLEKIDFSGRFHIAESKKTWTGMICIKPSDLVISWINVEKGALGIYEGELDILATIHYSSYEYDKNQIDIDYLRWFARSSEFKRILREQAGGGIKTEIKPKKFLSLEISLPDIEEQRSIVQSILSVQEDINKVNSLNNQNVGFVTNLRSSILQDAIQGELVPQDPSDEPASVLLNRIQKEKEELVKSGEIKKQKELPPIKSEEIPFELPKGWEWVRLWAIWSLRRWKSKHRPRNDPALFNGGNFPFIQTGDVARAKDNWFVISTVNGYYNEFGLSQSELHPTWTLCITIAANIADCGFLGFEACLPDSIVCFDSSNDTIKRYTFLLVKNAKEYLDRIAPSTAQKNINLDILENLPIPLPPLAEQSRIVVKADELMVSCDRLESIMKSSAEDSEKLLESVLDKVFNP